MKNEKISKTNEEKTCIELDVDVDNNAGKKQRLLAVGGDDGRRLINLVGGKLRENINVSCGGCSFVATTFRYYDARTNVRWKLTVPKRSREAEPMWSYIGSKGAGFKFHGRYTFNPTGPDALHLDTPADWP